MIVIRDATSSDMPAVRRTYNALIPHTTGTWTEELQTLPQRHAWFRRQTHAGHPVLVAVDAEVVIGFASYGSFRGSGKWPGYCYTVEHTVHVAETHWGRGVGRSLMETLIERARSADVHVMVGAIDSANTESQRFHERPSAAAGAHSRVSLVCVDGGR